MSESFFRLNFNYVYTRGITEKELKREIKKQRKCISLQEQRENFIAMVRRSK